MDLTFEPLDLQKSGWKNHVENFKIIEKLIYFLKIDCILAKLLPLEGGAILMAKVVKVTTLASAASSSFEAF